MSNFAVPVVVILLVAGIAGCFSPDEAPHAGATAAPARHRELVLPAVTFDNETLFLVEVDNNTTVDLVVTAPVWEPIEGAITSSIWAVNFPHNDTMLAWSRGHTGANRTLVGFNSDETGEIGAGPGFFDPYDWPLYPPLRDFHFALEAGHHHLFLSTPYSYAEWEMAFEAVGDGGFRVQRDEVDIDLHQTWYYPGPGEWNVDVGLWTHAVGAALIDAEVEVEVPYNVLFGTTPPPSSFRTRETMRCTVYMDALMMFDNLSPGTYHIEARLLNPTIEYAVLNLVQMPDHEPVGRRCS